MAPHRKGVSTINRRKFIRVASAAGVVGLAGCSGDGGSGGGSTPATTGQSGGGAQITLDYWTLFAGGDGPVMKSIVNRFNEERPLGDNIKIKRQRLPWTEYYNKLYTASVGGNVPDLGIVHTTYLRRLKRIFTSLDDMVDSSTLDKYHDSILKGGYVDETLYALPLDVHPTSIFVNKDVFEEAGVEIPSGTDPNEFKAAANALVEEDKLALGLASGASLMYMTFQPFLHQAGGQWFNDDMSEPRFNSDSGLAAAEFISQMTGDLGWDEPTIGDGRIEKAFQNGDMAMRFGGTWDAYPLEESGLNWTSIKPFILPDQEARYTLGSNHNIMLPRKPDRSDEKTKAAVDAAVWISQENPEWMAKAGHISSTKAISESDQVRESPIWDKSLKNFLEIIENDQIKYMPQPEELDFFNGEHWTWIEDIKTQKLSPQEGIQKGVEHFNSVL